MCDGGLPTAPPQKKRTRGDLYKSIDADYYGYRDEDDGVLVGVETRAEKVALASALDEWAATNRGAQSVDDVDSLDDGQHFVAHVPVPTKKDIEQALLKRKKEELLKKYAS
eukprot:GFYU01039120.1.p2 GENE.GFYU01039120.1~~GFYU01039120.1.p2  ORF type:complete len:111 (+),score=39.83 GFYU01039120.1:70-402(+)